MASSALTVVRPRESLRERVVTILANELTALRQSGMTFHESGSLNRSIYAPNPCAERLAISIVETLGELAKEGGDGE